jgi:hypothetical protein
MIDEDFIVYLIEANTNPCLETNSAVLSRIYLGETIPWRTVFTCIASFGIIQKVKRNTDSENKIDVFYLFDFVRFVQHIFQNFIYIDFNAIP